MTQIIAARHSFPEPAGFTIDRKNGHANWTFLHFTTPTRFIIDGKTIFAEPHACIIYKPREPQFFSSEVDVLHDWLHFDGVPKDFLLPFGLETNKIYYPEKHEFITRIIREIENENNSFLYNKERLLSLKIDELFIKLYRNCFEISNTSVSESLVSSLRYIRENMFRTLDSSHNVYSLANSVGLSQSRFFAVYKRLFGISPIDDLINARIDVAKNDLLGSNQKISSIARKLGYNDVTHFIRQFKSRVGVTPAQYRKQ